MITPEDLCKSGSEHGHQQALFCWASLNIDKYPQLQWLYAIPNGFFATPGQKAKMKAEGLKDGVPDVCLPVPRYDSWLGAWWHGLYIELKIIKRRNHKDGGCSKDQLEWIDYLTKADYRCHICYGWEDARDKILEYLND